jgi:hypothetical protein
MALVEKKLRNLNKCKPEMQVEKLYSLKIKLESETGKMEAAVFN